MQHWLIEAQGEIRVHFQDHFQVEVLGANRWKPVGVWVGRADHFVQSPKAVKSPKTVKVVQVVQVGQVAFAGLCRK
jgi:hypothetical protein